MNPNRVNPQKAGLRACLLFMGGSIIFSTPLDRRAAVFYNNPLINLI